jgi:hypothetical protein
VGFGWFGLMGVGVACVGWWVFVLSLTADVRWGLWYLVGMVVWRVVGWFRVGGVSVAPLVGGGFDLFSLLRAGLAFVVTCVSRGWGLFGDLYGLGQALRLGVVWGVGLELCGGGFACFSSCFWGCRQGAGFGCPCGEVLFCAVGCGLGLSGVYWMGTAVCGSWAFGSGDRWRAFWPLGELVMFGAGVGASFVGWTVWVGGFVV